MKILVDINVWIDIASRVTSDPSSLGFYRAAIEAGDQLCIPASGYTTLYYIINKQQGREAAMAFFSALDQQGVRVLPFRAEEISTARALNLKGFEDSCVAATGLLHGCQLLVSRDIKDFRRAPIRSATPKQYLKREHL